MAEALTETVRWTGSLSAGDQMTLTYQLTLPADPAHQPLYSVAFLEDGTGGAWERSRWLILDPWKVYLTVVYRNFWTPWRVYLPAVRRDRNNRAQHNTPRPYILHSPSSILHPTESTGRKPGN